MVGFGLWSCIAVLHGQQKYSGCMRGSFGQNVILTNGYAKYSVEVIHWFDRSGDYSIVAKCPVFGGTSRIQATCHVYRMYFS